MHFRLRRSGEDPSYDLIRADVRIENSTIFVHLGLADGEWPFVIENNSDYKIGFSQQVCRNSFICIDICRSM